MRRARELDPTDAVTHGLSSVVASQGRDAAAALEHARRAISLDPRLWIGYTALGQAYELAGDHNLALEALADAARLPGGRNSKIISLRGYVLAKMGRNDAAREVLATLETASHERYVPPYAIGARLRGPRRARGDVRCARKGLCGARRSPDLPARRACCGTPIGPIPASSIWLPAVGLGLPTDDAAIVHASIARKPCAPGCGHRHARRPARERPPHCCGTCRQAHPRVTMESRSRRCRSPSLLITLKAW